MITDRIAGLAAAASLMLLFSIIGLVWLSPRGDWIGFAGNIFGSLISAGVAATAIIYGWKGIRSQTRATLFAREEDRIERDLPGLHDLALVLVNLSALKAINLHPRIVMQCIQMPVFVSEDHNALDQVMIKLPRTDVFNQRTFAKHLTEIYMFASVAVTLGQDETDGHVGSLVATSASEAIHSMQMAIDALLAFQSDVDAQIARFDSDRTRVRSELRKYIRE